VRAVLSLSALAGLILCAAASANPVVLPSPKAHPGGTAHLEVVAPADASRCSVSFRGRGVRYGPYRVSLGGPTRMLSWRVPASAGGSWKARLSCRGGGRHGLLARVGSLGSGKGGIVIGHRGPPRGRLVSPRSLRVRPGSIPEMPVQAQLSVDNPLSDDGVDTGRKDEPFVPCRDSYWVATTRTTGEGNGTLIQFEPTSNARANALYALTPEAGRENNPVYHEMWEDLNRCAHFSPDINDAQRHSMYMQMACHARYGFAPRVGGNTWDLEAWRQNVDWSTGLSIGGHCGQQYGDLPTSTTGGFLVGRIVNGRAWAQPNPPEEIKAWLVLQGGTKPYRRHITTLKAYNCLAATHGKAQWFPHTFLENYVDVSNKDIGDAEACGAPSSPAPVPPASSPSPPLPPASGSPTQPAPGPPAPGSGPPPTVYVEQQGSLGANTFTNPYNASGMGVKIPPYAYVEVSCKVYAPQIVSANPDGYWYRIHSAPWSDSYYAVANTFWNGDTPGQKPYVHNTDFGVRDC